MDNKRISVVIPVHNRAHTIKRCINSILNQSSPVYEIILADDASTDNLAEVVTEISSSKIRIVKHTTNKGAQAARNTGIKAAKGNWIAFQDSDDEWLPNKIEKQLETIQKEETPYILIHSNAFKKYCDGKKEEYILPLTEGKAYKALLRRPSPVFPSMLTSKIALQEIGFLDEKVPTHQEWDTSIKLAKICKLIHIQTPLVIWNINETEVSISRNIPNRIKGYEYVFKKHINSIKEFENANEIIFYHWLNLYKRAEQYGLKQEQTRIIKELKGFKKRETVLLIVLSIIGKKHIENPSKSLSFFIEVLFRIWKYM